MGVFGAIVMLVSAALDGHVHQRVQKGPLTF